MWYAWILPESQSNVKKSTTHCLCVCVCVELNNSNLQTMHTIQNSVTIRIWIMASSNFFAVSFQLMYLKSKKEILQQRSAHSFAYNWMPVNTIPLAQMSERIRKLTDAQIIVCCGIRNEKKTIPLLLIRDEWRAIIIRTWVSVWLVMRQQSRSTVKFPTAYN